MLILPIPLFLCNVSFAYGVQRGLQGHSVTFMRKRQSKRNRHICVYMRAYANISNKQTKARQNGDTCVHTRLCTCTYIQMSSYFRRAILAKGEPRFILSPPSTHNTSWVFGLAVVAVRPELPHLDAERWGDNLLRVFYYFLAVGIISATATPTVTSVMPGVLAWLGQQHVVVALAVGPVGVDPSMPSPNSAKILYRRIRYYT